MTYIVMSCDFYNDVMQVAETLSQDILLSSHGPGQHNLPHTIGSIREVRCI